jgi:hypothetical protein
LTRKRGRRALAANEQLKELWFNEVLQWEEGAIVVPATVLTETTTGYPRDARMNRLLNEIGPADEVFIPTTAAIARRAGILRTDALAAARDPHRRISATDAEVVAIAEHLSGHMGVTILTSDHSDIELLVEMTRRSNISVEPT